MKRSLKLAIAAVAVAGLLGLGGCAGTGKTLENNKAGITGAVVTGVVVNAAGCGMSWPFCAARTALGAAAGWFGGKAIAGEK